MVTENLEEVVMRFLTNIINSFIETAPYIIGALITLAISYGIYRLLRKTLSIALDKSKMPKALISMALSIFSLIYWYFSATAILGMIPGLEALASAMGNVISFFSMGVGIATSGLIKDLVSGIMLVSDKNFQVGIKVKVAGVEGVIKEIDIRRTRIEDDKGNIYIVPNNVIEPSIWTIKRETTSSESLNHQ